MISQQMTKEQEDICNALIKSGKSKVKVEWEDGTTENIRIFRGTESCQICRFRRRSRRFGYPINFSKIVKITPLESKKTPEQKWESAWKKVLSRLEKSGLWSEIAEDIKISFEIGYPILQEAREEYWASHMSEEDAEKFLLKYPKLRKSKDGRSFINTNILWHISELPKVKKMYFERKERNNIILEQIKKHMDDKEPCEKSGRARYDVSFEYNPKINKAWYSEEYRGCGNGHYYLALDATHAIFYEDD